MKISKRQEEIVKATLQHAVVAVRDIPNSALIGFMPHLKEAQAQLTRELKAWELKQDGGQRYTAHTKRSALAQIEAALDEIEALGPTMNQTLMVSGTKAAEAGLNAMQQQLASLNAMFEGAMVPVSIDRARILSEGKKLLVKKYPKSAARYAGKIRDDVKRHLAVGTLQQKTITQMANAMYAEIPGVFNSARGNAMRLVRTEVMNSYNDAHHEGLLDANEEDSDVKMRWDASYDPRRCPECGKLDGQIVEVDKQFSAQWVNAQGAARSSLHTRPPAHPNCRCVLVPWIDDWPDTDWNVDPPDDGIAPDATYVFGKGAHQIPQKILSDEAAAKLKKEEQAKANAKEKALKAQAFKDAVAKQMQEKLDHEAANAAKKAQAFKEAQELKKKIEAQAKEKLAQAETAKLNAAQQSAAMEAAKKKAAAALAKAKQLAELEAKAKQAAAIKAKQAAEAAAKKAAADAAKKAALEAKAKATAEAKAKAAAAKEEAAKKAKLSAAAKKGAATKAKKAAKLIADDKKLSEMSIPGLKGKATGIQKKIDSKFDEKAKLKPGTPGYAAKLKKIDAEIKKAGDDLGKVNDKLYGKEVAKKAKDKWVAKQQAAAKEAADKATAHLSESDKKAAKEAEAKIAQYDKSLKEAHAKAEATQKELDKLPIGSPSKAELSAKLKAEWNLAEEEHAKLQNWKKHKAHILAPKEEPLDLMKEAAKISKAEKAKALAATSWDESKAAGLEKFVKEGKTYQQAMPGGGYYPTGDEVNKAYEIFGDGKKPPGFKEDLVGKGPQAKSTTSSYKPKPVELPKDLPPDGEYDDKRKRLQPVSRTRLEAMKSDHGRIMDALPHNETRAVVSYTGTGYHAINDGLRGVNREGDRVTLTDTAKKHIKELDKVYKKATLDDDHVVYRGVSFHKDWRPPKVGQLWEDKGYGSTSVSLDSKFPGDGHFTIEVPKGTPAVFVSKISAVGEGERELLLGRGARYRVVKLETKIVYGRPQHHYLMRVESTALSRGED